MSKPVAGGVAARLFRYAVVLTEAQRTGRARITSQELAAYTGVNATQIRRELSSFGKFGTRGLGYSVEALLGEIRKLLFRKGEQRLALVGVGRLGQAIANSPIFAEYGVSIAAILDSDAGKVGTRVAGLVVEDTSRLRDVVREREIAVGVLAVPAASAQPVASDLAEAGVRIIFNYTDALLDLPEGVRVLSWNPATQLVAALVLGID